MTKRKEFHELLLIVWTWLATRCVRNTYIAQEEEPVQLVKSVLRFK